MGAIALSRRNLFYMLYQVREVDALGWSSWRHCGCGHLSAKCGACAQVASASPSN